MNMFINQMLGCLIIAAAIGGVVGWLLRNVSAGTVAQQLADVTAMMRLKEQMLEKARRQLRDPATKVQPIDSEKVESSTRSEYQPVDTDRLLTRLQESEAAGGWVEWLDVQLAERDEKHRRALHEIERQLAERDLRLRGFEQLHEQLMKQAEDNEILKAAYQQVIGPKIDKAA
jgi:hypothetical protein